MVRLLLASCIHFSVKFCLEMKEKTTTFVQTKATNYCKTHYSTLFYWVTFIAYFRTPAYTLSLFLFDTLFF